MLHNQFFCTLNNVLRSQVLIQVIRVVASWIGMRVYSCIQISMHFEGFVQGVVDNPGVEKVVRILK